MNKKPTDQAGGAPQMSELWSLLGLTEDADPAMQSPRSPFWRRTWFRTIASALVILMPVYAYLAYDLMSTAHRPITITTGPQGGRHRQIGLGVAERIETMRLAEVERTNSRGSLENMRRMQVGEVDFAIYQSGTDDILGDWEFDRLDELEPKGVLTIDEFPSYWSNHHLVLKTLDANRDNRLQRDEFRDPSRLRFVANLFSEAVHFIVRDDAGISTDQDLIGKRVGVGEVTSGSYAMSRVILEHFGISEDQMEMVDQDYDQLLKGLTTDDPAERVDAVFLTAGLAAPHVNRIMATGVCQLLPIDRRETLCMQRVFCSPTEIPPGLYRGSGEPSRFLPPVPIPTVSVQAELLVHRDVGPHLVRQLTRSILSDEFLKDNALHELYRKDPITRRQVAQSKPDFAVHLGAGDYYDPHEFDAGAFEGWEALYSLIASAVIASMFVVRWLIKRRNRLRGHRLDGYLNKLLKIELRQAALDAHPDQDDTRQLQMMLHEITALRQQALGEFSAHELNEDPAQYCFLEMCHYISEKIDAKLLRQRLDRNFVELSESRQDVSLDKADDAV